MGYSTTYLDQRIIDDLTRVTPFSPPATLWWALTTVVLTRTDVAMPSGAEMVGAGYARKDTPNDNTTWGAATFDAVANLWTAANIIIIRFAQATADYPATPGWAALDDPIAGNVLYAGTFTNPSGSPVAGQNPTIAVGQATITVSGQ
jgi:hypothetical protein